MHTAPSFHVEPEESAEEEYKRRRVLKGLPPDVSAEHSTMAAAGPVANNPQTCEKCSHVWVCTEDPPESHNLCSKCDLPAGETVDRGHPAAAGPVIRESQTCEGCNHAWVLTDDQNHHLCLNCDRPQACSQCGNTGPMAVVDVPGAHAQCRLCMVAQQLQMYGDPATKGPASAAGLRSLMILPRLLDIGIEASDLPAPTPGQVGPIVERYRQWRQQPQLLADGPFNTVSTAAPTLEVARKKMSQDATKITNDCRRLEAWLKFMVKCGARLTWDVFFPNAQLWQHFAYDCEQQPKPVQDLTAYAALLTGFTAQLNDQLGESHSVRRYLSANGGQPWHATDLAKISKAYKEGQARRKATSAAQGVDPGGSPSSEAEHAALAAPVYLLDSWLQAAEEELTAREKCKVELATAEVEWQMLPDHTKGRRRSPEHRGIETKIKALQRDFKFFGAIIGGYAVTFAQFIYMLRASSVAGGLENGGMGIEADLAFSEDGLTYVVRFMKHWTADTSHHGEKLPFVFSAANAVPRGNSDAKFPCEPRERMLRIIEYALSEKDDKSGDSLMSSIDSISPETQGSQKINKHLRSIKATNRLQKNDRKRAGLSQSISSHSIRKAAISMALASGVSAANLRRWTRWRNEEMVWHYAQIDYVVPVKWKQFFAWMIELPAQSA